MAERPTLRTRLSRKFTEPPNRPSLSHRRSLTSLSFNEEQGPAAARRARLKVRGRSTLGESTPLVRGDDTQEDDRHDDRDRNGRDRERRLTTTSSSQDVSDKEPRSAFDKKTDLLNDEIDRLGFGRYQWGLFIVCGSGWVLDLLWAQAFGLALPQIQRELRFSEAQYGWLSTGFSIGLTLGALTWGILLDTIGRRPAFNYTVAISSVFGAMTGFVSSYPLLILLAAGVGFGVGGNIPVDTTIFLEFIPKDRRNMLVVMSIFQPIGTILATVMAWAVIPPYSCTSDDEPCRSEDNRGWRYLFYTVAAVTVLVFVIRFVLFHMLESPAFLLSQGKDRKVVDVLREVAERNGKQCELSYEELSGQDDDDELDDHDRREGGQPTAMEKEFSKFDLSHLKLLFKNRKMAKLTTLTWLIYAADFWGFTLAGVFLPKILLQKGATNNVSLQDTYLEYIIIMSAGLPGAILSMLIVQRKGRRRITMAISSALMATSLFLFATVNSQTGNIAFNAVEYFCQTVFNAILYAWTPEVFESSVRGAATGIAAFWGRFISIIAPVIGGLVFALPDGGNRVLFCAGGGTLVATLCIILL